MRRCIGSTAICEHCGAEFTLENGNQKFCLNCSGNRKRAYNKKPGPKRPSKFHSLAELLAHYETSQRDFAQRFGIDPTLVCRWCTGARACPPYVIAMADEILSRCGLEGEKTERRADRRIDLTGRDFGEWHVLGPAGKSASGRPLWHCRCSCGTERDVSASNLRSGQTTSCGHTRGIKRRADITGQRFGQLVAVERVGSRKNQSLWLCKCDCGNTTVAAMSNLKEGHTTSCGCALKRAQKSPDARVAAQALSPLTRPGEHHIAARSFRLCFGGQVYDVHNLRNFVREHPEVFGISGDPSSVNAASKALYDAGSRGYTWHGWSVTREDGGQQNKSQEEKSKEEQA